MFGLIYALMYRFLLKVLRFMGRNDKDPFKIKLTQIFVSYIFTIIQLVIVFKKITKKTIFNFSAFIENIRGFSSNNTLIC